MPPSSAEQSLPSVKKPKVGLSTGAVLEFRSRRDFDGNAGSGLGKKGQPPKNKLVFETSGREFLARSGGFELATSRSHMSNKKFLAGDGKGGAGAVEGSAKTKGTGGTIHKPAQIISSTRHDKHHITLAILDLLSYVAILDLLSYVENSTHRFYE